MISTATWKVLGLILNGVIGVFHQLNPSGHTMVLESTSASNGNEYQELLGEGVGKDRWCVGLLATLQPSHADGLEILGDSIS